MSKNQSKCFVIMPFSETRHTHNGEEIVIPAREWDLIYEGWIKRAVESYNNHALKCLRSSTKSGNFVKDIIKDIAESDIVIADLTGGKANVYYELGIRHSLQIGTILITQHISALPSDLGSYFAFEYRYTNKDTSTKSFYNQFESKLHSHLDHFNSGEVTSDSPVSDFLGFRSYLKDIYGFEDKRNMRWILSACVDAINSNFKTSEYILRNFYEDVSPNVEFLPRLDTFPLENVISIASSIKWNFLSEAAEILMPTIDKHRQVILTVRETFLLHTIIQNEDTKSSLLNILEWMMGEYRETLLDSWEEMENAFKEIGLSLIVSREDGTVECVAKRDFEEPKI